tara:strand:+ start:1674 stop:1952 length:279 start_codon:yes stop_codon:yes gene_type:complete
MNNDKLLYLKALCKEKGSDEKVVKEIKEAVDFLNRTNGFNEFTYKPEVKVKDPITDLIEGREFILKNTEDFLSYAIDYSMVDKINDIIGSEK